MPEGPEILYFSTLLNKKLVGYKFALIESFTDKPIKIPDDWENMTNTIVSAGSKGKLLWLYIKGARTNYYMYIHFGITGWLHFKKPKSNIKYSFVLERDDKKIELYMEDKRRLSKIAIGLEIEHEQIIESLGIDIFEPNFTLENFRNLIWSKNMILAGFLLKQEIICGIGNYIKNESMYMGQLNAHIKTNNLTREQIEELYKNILIVAYSNLIEMLSASKIQKFLDVNKKTNIQLIKLEIPYKYKIYGRTYTETGEKVKKIKVAGRDTYCIETLC